MIDSNDLYVEFSIKVLYADISGTALRLWIILLFFHVHNNRKFPTIEDLSQLLRKSKRKIFYLLSELKEANLISIKKDKQNRNIYQFPSRLIKCG